MALLPQFFDRCIDLHFYDDNGVPLPACAIRCQASGYKPDITVEVTEVAPSMGISGKVTITNYLGNMDTLAAHIRIIQADLYYGNCNAANFVSAVKGRTYYLNVLDFDLTKNAPDRQITFYCQPASYINNCLSALVDIKAPVDGEGKPQSITLTSALSTCVEAYNKALLSDCPTLEPKLKLKGVNTKLYPQAKTLKYFPHRHQGLTVGDMLRLLPTLNYVKKKADGAEMEYVPSCNWLIVDNEITAVPLPSAAPTFIPQKKKVFLNSVLSAVHTGVVVTVRSLFIPEIKVGSTVVVPQSCITGGVVGVTLTPISDKLPNVMFNVLPGLKVVFGTVRQNEMVFKGNAL